MPIARSPDHPITRFREGCYDFLKKVLRVTAWPSGVVDAVSRTSDSPSRYQVFVAERGPFGVSVVLMWVELPDGVLREIPLATHPVHIEPWTPRKKRERARVLAAAIGNFVDPQRWPAVDMNKLRRLRPPQRQGETRDFG